MSDKISLIIEATDNASSVLGGIGQSIGNLGRIAGGLALGGVAAMGAGLLKLGSDGLSLNNSMEKVTAQLNAFTKDGAKTADIIETVRERAAKTPFEFDAMAKAAVALFPASKTAQGGLEGILEKAEILAASNPAEGLEGAAFALKEAVSGDFTSIIERFNLPRQYINDLKKEGVPNLEIVQRAMKEMGLDVDLVSNLANTAEGRWSTFKDTLSGVAATATKPIFDAMSNSLAGVNGLLEANTPLLNQVGATIAGVLTQGITSLSAILPPIVAAVVGFGTSIKTTFDTMSSTLAPFIATIGANLTGLIPSITSIGASIQQIFGSLIPIALAQGQGAWTMISTTIQTVITSAIAILQTWLPVVQTVLAGIAAFLAQHGTEIQLLVSTAWNSITTIIQTAITTVTTIINALAPVVNEIFGAISAFLNAHGSEILGFLTTSWNSISAIVSGVAAIIQTVVTTVFGAVASFIKNHGDQIQAVLAGAWNFIKTTVGETLNIIKNIVSTVLAIINGDWDTAWKGIQSITESSNNIIKTLIDTAMRLIESVITLAVNNFRSGWETGWQLMRTATDTAMTLIKDAINTGIETAKTIIANGVEAFLGKFRDLRDKMSTIGQQLLEGMVQGIRDKVGWLVDEAVRASNAVLAAIKNTLGIKSPSVEGYETSAYLIEGLTNGINDNANDWVSAGEDAANRLVERIRVIVSPLPDIMSAATEPIVTQTVSQFSGLADGVEDQLLTVAESFVELAQTGDTSSLHFAQSFEAIKRAFAQLVPSFGDVQKNFDVLFATMANGKFDVQTFWDAWGKMLHEVKIGSSATLDEVNRGLLDTYIVFEDGSYHLRKLEQSTHGLADGVEDQLLTVAESFVELAQTGDTSSLHFAQSFEAIKRAFAQLVPSFGDVQKNFDVLFATMANGEFDVQTFWDAWGKMLHEVKIGSSATLDEVNRGLLDTYIVFEDGSYHLRKLEQSTQASFQHIAETVTTNTNIARDAANNSFENILVVAGVAINTLTGEVLNSSNTMSSAMNSLANTVTGATQTMQTQASSAAQSIAASMIAAGQVINTTQQQLAGFIQNGGVGGITGGTYTPSAAFQALFTNPPPAPVIAPPRPSSIPKGNVVNNTPISITINSNAAVDRYAVEEGTMSALRRAGLTGRFA